MEALVELLDGSFESFLPMDDRIHYERTIAAIRAQIDADTFAAAWAAGRTLTLEQAIAESLSR